VHTTGERKTVLKKGRSGPHIMIPSCGTYNSSDTTNHIGKKPSLTQKTLHETKKPSISLKTKPTNTKAKLNVYVSIKREVLGEFVHRARYREASTQN